MGSLHLFFSRDKCGTFSFFLILHLIGVFCLFQNKALNDECVQLGKHETNKTRWNMAGGGAGGGATYVFMVRLC